MLPGIYGYKMNMVFEMVRSNKSRDEFEYIWCNVCGYASLIPGIIWVFSYASLRHNVRDSVSNYQPHDCLSSRLFGRRSKKTSKLRLTSIYAGNSPVTGKFLAQMASKAKCFHMMASLCQKYGILKEAICVMTYQAQFVQ